MLFPNNLISYPLNLEDSSKWEQALSISLLAQPNPNSAANPVIPETFLSTNFTSPILAVIAVTQTLHTKKLGRLLRYDTVNLPSSTLAYSHSRQLYVGTRIIQYPDSIRCNYKLKIVPESRPLDISLIIYQHIG